MKLVYPENGNFWLAWHKSVHDRLACIVEMEKENASLAELRERKLMNKYNELKEAGKLDAFMEKRWRKNASKDHRFMPYRRSGDV
ncbi:hypothetical protein ZEAMMB73_Zm00001d018345 [Zea mays]|uniref:rRNA biogenesis protein RRP36 n=2 Tax=Zea mays TaxID=4577 RepID=A0A1D6HMY7_MAIZE|nr:hypothetical protein ZEAMMB73_Zm00001d018345 [Zea mays]AQK75676.1 hypothetical protein ZEAMMB73_Zm00001d018345 [Zea mays]